MKIKRCSSVSVVSLVRTAGPIFFEKTPSDLVLYGKKIRKALVVLFFRGIFVSHSGHITHCRHFNGAMPTESVSR